MNPRASDFRAAGRNSLKDNWGTAVGICFVAELLVSIAGGVTFIIGGLGSLIIYGPLWLGMIAFFSRRALGIHVEFDALFSGFNNFLKAMGLYLFMGLFIFLWSLLFVIPGIIAGLRYSMAPYLLAEYPDMGIREAVDRSKELMNGNKGRLFCMHLSFIGWYLLTPFTLGILALWLVPYVQAAEACFYMHLTGRIMQAGQTNQNPGAGSNADSEYAQTDHAGAKSEQAEDPTPESI